MPQSVGNAAGFRRDIEGLRAVALGAVLLYHAQVPWASGGFIGVDVFFVISGYLITGLLWREIESTGRIDLAAFYARRVRRLLPAAVLVLLVTALVSRAVLPILDWEQVRGDIVAAALYVSNIAFASAATDYLANPATPSPVLHYWSLAVEEQFYLVWPALIIIAAGAWGARVATVGRADPWRRTVAVVAILVGASLLGSVALTTVSQPWAFFGLPSRAWQFGVGALVALAGMGGASVDRVRSGDGWRRIALGYGGLALVVASIVVLDDRIAYPGWFALLPTLGTAAIIWSGGPELRGVSRPLSLSGLRAVGRISYSWYLWHWPFVVFALVLFPEAGPALPVVATLASWLPAYLAYRYVETPLRRRTRLLPDPRSAGVFAAGATAAAALVSVVALPAPRAVLPESPQETATISEAWAPVPAPSGPLQPQPADARNDVPRIYADGCHVPIPESEPVDCRVGRGSSTDTTGSGASSIALFGDSHAAQWFPALEEAIEGTPRPLVVHTKSGCPAADVVVYSTVLKRRYLECENWRSSALQLLAEDPPDIVFIAEYRRHYLRTNADSPLGPLSPADWDAALSRTIRTLQEAGSKAVLLADTPALPFDPPGCVLENATETGRCSTPVAGATAPDELHAVSRSTGAPVADLTAGICLSEVCPSVRANRLVYRDDNHLSASYSTALAPVWRAVLDRVDSRSRSNGD